MKAPGLKAKEKRRRPQPGGGLFVGRSRREAALALRGLVSDAITADIDDIIGEKNEED